MRFTLCSSNAKEAETREDYFYARPVGRSGGVIRQNSVSGHIHARRGGAENQPAGVSRPGESKTPDLHEHVFDLCSHQRRTRGIIKRKVICVYLTINV